MVVVERFFHSTYKKAFCNHNPVRVFTLGTQHGVKKALRVPKKAGISGAKSMHT